MTSFAYASLILATTVAGGCAAAPADQAATGGGKADGQAAALTFNADYTQAQSGSLLAGDSVQIAYALDRLTSCKTETGGMDQYGVGGYASFDGGTPVQFGLSRLSNGKAVPVTADLAIPASASHVSMWFAVSDSYGCIAYDSNENANYEFSIDRHGLGAVLSFDSNGTPSQSGALHAGDQIVLHYDPARLATCAGETGGNAAYSITGYWSVDAGTTHTLTVSRSSGASLEAGDPTITLPHGSDLAVWFDSSNVWGCHAYDSASGANYHFAIN